eukprot:5032095-Karenia_brevis.AAC.1
MRREFATKQRHEQWFNAIREHQITGNPIVVPPVVARRAKRRAECRERKEQRIEAMNGAAAQPIPPPPAPK